MHRLSVIAALGLPFGLGIDGRLSSAEHDLGVPMLSSASFYASFDEEVKGDLGKGQLTFDTRYNHATEKGAFVVEKGYPKKAFRVAKDKGVAGGA